PRRGRGRRVHRCERPLRARQDGARPPRGGARRGCRGLESRPRDRLSSKEGKSLMQEFRIASWNVLATAHIKPAYFRATPREVLFEECRLPAVLDRIAELPAAAIFRQDVARHVFDA